MSDVYVALMYGQGGSAVDTILSGNGLGALARKISGLEGVSCRLLNWDQGTKIAGEIRKLPKETKVVIGGASLGANETPAVCSYVFPRKVDYIFGCQPSLYGRKNPVTGNVVKALCIYAPWYAIWTLGFGSYQWQYLSSKTEKQWMTSALPHPGDSDPRVHSAVLAEIQRLMV